MFCAAGTVAAGRVAGGAASPDGASAAAARRDTAAASAGRKFREVFKFREFVTCRSFHAAITEWFSLRKRRVNARRCALRDGFTTGKHREDRRMIGAGYFVFTQFEPPSKFVQNRRLQH